MAQLKSFEEARQRAGALNRFPPRVYPIPVRCIVGSVDGTRRTALRSDFLPRRFGAQDDRYQSVLRALQDDVPLAAIEVYALGGVYFVVDGHHRVAAARALGYAYIDALVHEFPLQPEEARAVEPSSRRSWRMWRPHREQECPCGS
jgi:hypothetical protein